MKFSIVIFFIVLLCFFFPFVEVSCGGHKVMKFTGIQLVTGGEIEKPEMFSGNKKVEKYRGETFAILAFLSVIAGLIMSIGVFKGKPFQKIRALAGLSGAVFLLLLRTKINNEALKQGEGILETKFTIAYWLALFMFLVSFILNFFFVKEEK